MDLLLEKKQIELWIHQILQNNEQIETNYKDHIIKFAKIKQFNPNINSVIIKDAIFQIFHLVEYIRYSKYLPIYKSQKGYQIYKITKLLKQFGQIQQNQYRLIKQHVETVSIEASIERLLLIVEKVQQNKKLIKKWKQIMPINIEIFWQKFVPDRKINNQLIQKLKQKYDNALKMQKYQNQQIQNNKLLSNIYDSQDHKLQLKLKQCISRHILFNYVSRLNIAKDQLITINQILKKRVFKIQGKQIKIRQIETFGSLRSEFALKYDADADLSCLLDIKQVNRQDQIHILKQIIQSIKEQQQNLFQKQKYGFILIDKIKTPVIFMYNNKKDSKGEIHKIDIVLNNIKGINNSRLLHKFSKSEYIKQFAIMIKSWAKMYQVIRNNLLSSYGVILMVLSYLMYTEQLDFIEQLENKEKENIVIPKLQIDQKKFFPLLHNFKGFLKFYNQNGRFFKENLIVRITKFYVCDRQTFILYNMIDPIDYSNPGRMRVESKQIIFKAINQTLIKIQNCKITNVQSLFYKYQHKQKKK